ncbi:PREDICTED: HAUS augmin-like complex subunit 6 [Nanorana parkeri]|uniref:HAUS augmin-like complex subunit 6 n=1 Tax=Nanorana parkeri TaxID=125878 RepID=UPI000854E76B|nr:PREDICTED: HAUS augmin-like complex subunit 6 [Nanorana parkeri]
MQSAARSQSPWRKEHLWLTLQALGFELGAEAATLNKTLAHVCFGMHMFDKPNKDAFYVVFHFLFSKLNAVQCREIFRHCWPPLDKKKDAEFRKASYEWLRKISEDAGSGFPQVVASIFLSPGGPKFIQLLYHFARYVMLQHIKRNVDGTNSYIPDSLQFQIQHPEKALARNKLARQRYLRALQRENFMVREYQKKAQLLVKEIRELRSEYGALQNQGRATQNVKNDENKEDKIKEVRSLWENIMTNLKAMEKEVEVVDSAIVGDDNQYCLDGSKVSLNIPSALVSRIESEMHRLQIENVYEAGKVNFITIVQLLNETLKVIKLEQDCNSGQELQVDPQYLAAKTKFETEVFTRLRHTRHKIKREDLVSINKSIVEKQKDWEKKWKRILGKSPFGHFKGLNPVLELQPALAPFLFDPAAEEALRGSVFSQYTVTITDVSVEDSDTVDQDHNGFFTSFMDATLFTPRGRKSLPFQKITPTQRRMSLNEMDFRTPTSAIKERFLQRTPNSLQKRRSDVTWKPTQSIALPHTPTLCKPDGLRTARLQLAQQVADLIVNDPPKSQSGRGMELDDLLGMLSSDPFLSKKEIPRTPENLISDIRISWRKAIQSEEFCNVSSPVENLCVQSPVEQESAHCSLVDLSMACFLSASHLSEQNESPDPRMSLSSGKPDPHYKAGLNPNLTPFLVSEIKKSEQDKFTPLKECDKMQMLPSVVGEKNLTFIFDDQPDNKLKDSTIIIPAPSRDNVLTHSTLSWDSSKAMDYSISSESHDVTQFGILHETIPEGVGNMSLNSTSSAQTPEIDRYDTRTEIGEIPLDSTVGGWETMERKMDIDSIRTRYEALKRTFFTSLTEERNIGEYTPLSRVPKQKSDSCLPTETSGVFNALDKGLTLDFEYLATLSPRDRKLSLPQLISFSPCEDHVRASSTEDFSDVFEPQGTGNINKTIDFTHSASDLQKSTDLKEWGSL